MGGPRATMSYGIHGSADRQVVTLAGDVDLASAERLRTLLIEVAWRASSVEVDLLMVGFLDSAGISALVAGRNAAHANGCTFRIRRASEPARAILEVSALLDAFGRPAAA
jgi:anti-sigma B factor antagonist